MQSMCNDCNTRLVTDGKLCDLCLVAEMVDGDIIAAYQEGVISEEEYKWMCEPTDAQLTEADEERFFQLMKRIDGED